MKRILLFASIMVMALTGAMVSCYFDAARDNVNDPKSGEHSSKIYMFATDPMNGERGGRIGLDQLCADKRNASYPNLPGNHVHAFVSVDIDDSIINFPVEHSIPTEFPIISPTNKTIAENWNKLVQRNFVNTPYDAQVTSFVDWWSGTADSGGIGAEHCFQWSDDSTDAIQGWTNNATEFFNYKVQSCVTTYPFLCICWE